MFRKSNVIWGMIFVHHLIFAQPENHVSGKLSGRVIDADSKLGVAGAFVFIAHTTKGEQTNKDGFFAFAPAPREGEEIVIAKSGYETVVQKYQPQNGQIVADMLLQPKPKGQNLQMQTVAENIQRAYFIEEVKKILLGMPEQGAQCKLMNEQALDFFYNEQTRVLEAYASEPLIIENYVTGYRIVFDLENFTCFRLDEKIRYTYHGYAFFMEMIPQLDGNLTDWRKNRDQAYRGSLRHFLQLLNTDDLAGSGFAVNLAEFSMNNNSLADIAMTVELREIARPHHTAGQKVLKFPNFLKVVYEGGGMFETSWLYLNKQFAIFDAQGRFIAPLDPVTVHGSWATRNLSQILPRDYSPRPINTLDYNK